MKTQPNRTNHFYFKNKPLSLLAWLFLFSCFSSTGLAQQLTGITVRVKDPQGAVVVKAALTLYTRDNRVRLRALTDDKGTYVFEDLTSGEYLIEAEAAGFAPAEAQVVRIADQGFTTFDITLPLASVSEQVVVTAQGSVQPVDEVSKAISVVDQQDIDNRDEAAIPEALRVVPGLRVQQLGGPGSFTAIKTTGMCN